jgi:hypothetical protein
MGHLLSSRCAPKSYFLHLPATCTNVCSDFSPICETYFCLILIKHFLTLLNSNILRQSHPNFILYLPKPKRDSSRYKFQSKQTDGVSGKILYSEWFTKNNSLLFTTHHKFDVWHCKCVHTTDKTLPHQSITDVKYEWNERTVYEFDKWGFTFLKNDYL